MNYSGKEEEEEDDDDDDHKEVYLRAQFVTGLFCYPVVCLFGLAGNALSIALLLRQKMRPSTKTYLVSMALSDAIKLITDTCYFVVVLLANVDRSVGERAYGYLYPYAHYFFNMSVCTTAWLTVSVAAERYILVCHPTRRRRRRRDVCDARTALVTCLGVLLATVAVTIPLGIRYKTRTGLQNGTNESVVWIEVTQLWLSEDFVAVYSWIQNLLRSVIPLVILCALNWFIVSTLRRSTLTFRKTLSSRHRITLTLVAIIVIFMVCVTPDAIVSTLFGYGYCDAPYLVRAVREVTDLLLTLNSALNFLLYCTFSRPFRMSLRSVCLSREDRQLDTRLHGPDPRFCRTQHEPLPPPLSPSKSIPRRRPDE